MPLFPCTSCFSLPQTFCLCSASLWEQWPPQCVYLWPKAGGPTSQGCHCLTLYALWEGGCHKAGCEWCLATGVALTGQCQEGARGPGRGWLWALEKVNWVGAGAALGRGGGEGSRVKEGSWEKDGEVLLTA